MTEYHQRHMASSAALKAWARMARTLDIEMIAPQHGAIIEGKPLVKRFIDWCENIKCGLDLMTKFRLPPKRS